MNILFKTGEEAATLPTPTLIPTVFGVSFSHESKQKVDNLIATTLHNSIPIIHGNSVAYYGDDARRILSTLCNA